MKTGKNETAVTVTVFIRCKIPNCLNYLRPELTFSGCGNQNVEMANQNHNPNLKTEYFEI